MSVLRKILAVVVLILTVVGFLICAAGIFGAWYYNGPVKEAGDQALNTVIKVMDMTDNLASQADSAINEVSVRVAAVEEAAAGVADTRLASVVDRLSNLGAPIGRLSETTGAIGDGAQALSDLLVAVNRLPMVDIAAPTESLETASARASAVSEGLASMEAAVSGAQLDGSRLTAAAQTVSAELDQLDDTLSRWQGALGASRQAAQNAQERLPLWVNLTSVALTALLVLFGAGQISLFVHGLGWLKE